MNEDKITKQLYRSILKVVLTLAFCVLIPWVSVAQNVTVDVSIDSLQRFIGEQARIKLEVSCASSQKVQMQAVWESLC